MDFFLWSRAAVGQLIEQEYDIKLHVRSIGKYLARLGFTPQKPIQRAYGQSPEAVQAWLKGEYPAIEQHAKGDGAEIHWGDETARVNTDVRGRVLHLQAKPSHDRRRCTAEAFHDRHCDQSGQGTLDDY